MKAEILILGVLHRGDLHPYEIKRRLRAAQVECYVDFDVGTLYYAVRRLEAEQFIVARGRESKTRGRERTVYAITQKGRARFRELMSERFADSRPGFHPLYPALLFLHTVEASEAADAIRRRIEGQRRALAASEALLAGIGQAAGTGTRYLLKNMLAHQRTELRWLTEFLAQIESRGIQDSDLASTYKNGALARATRKGMPS